MNDRGGKTTLSPKSMTQIEMTDHYNWLLESISTIETVDYLITYILPYNFIHLKGLPSPLERVKRLDSPLLKVDVLIK